MDYDDGGFRITESDTFYKKDSFVQNSGIDLKVSPGGFFASNFMDFNNARAHLNGSSYIQYNHSSSTISVHGLPTPTWSPLTHQQNGDGGYLFVCHKEGTNYATIGPFKNNNTEVVLFDHCFYPYGTYYVEETLPETFYLSVPFSDSIQPGFGGNVNTLVGGIEMNHSHSGSYPIYLGCGDCQEACNLCDGKDLPNTVTVTISGTTHLRCIDFGDLYGYDGSYELERVGPCYYAGTFPIPGYPHDECSCQGYFNITVQRWGSGMRVLSGAGFFGGESFYGCDGGSEDNTLGPHTFTVTLEM